MTEVRRLRTICALLAAPLVAALSACLFPSFDGFTCDGDCAGAGGGSGGSGGSSAGPCGPDGVLIDGPGDVPYCIGRTEVPLGRYCDFLDAVVDGLMPQTPTVCAWKPSAELTECLVDDSDACVAIPQTCGDSTRPNGHLPAVGRDWCGASIFCAWDGKRLCGKVGGGADDDPLRSEWAVACKPETTTPSACKVAACQSHLDLDSGGSSCEGGVAGLFNMVGNVAEWVDNCEGTAGSNDYCEPRGGDCYEGPADAACSSFAAPRPRSAEDLFIGFRCCWDP